MIGNSTNPRQMASRSVSAGPFTGVDILSYFGGDEIVPNSFSHGSS